jgi:hypothetical protein
MMTNISLSTKQYCGLPQTVERIAAAIKNEIPFSLVRLGDGENIVLAQEKIFSEGWIHANVKWSRSADYCGVTLPNLQIRDRMVEALHQADMIGVFIENNLTQRIFEIYNICPKSICYAFDNLYLPMHKPFVDLIREYPPLLVGRSAGQFSAFLYQKLGIKVPGTVPIDNSFELFGCISKMAKIPHQWSLISAGCNAVIIASVMAASFGKVSIDFGHAPDNIMSPDVEYWMAVD